jgi:transcriptional regulator with XRE-family HTH domain
MQFHERLYEVRKRSGMTQNDLADRLNVSRQAVSRWEMGTAKPDFENLIAISDLFGISIDYLLKGREEEPQSVFRSEAGVDNPEAESNAHTLPQKLWLLVVVVFIVLGIFLSIAAGDPSSGFISTFLMMLGFGVLIGVICLIVVIVREVLKRLK